MNQPRQPTQPDLSFGIIAGLSASGRSVLLALERKQDPKGNVYLEGGLLPGQRLPVVALLEEIVPGLDAPDGLERLSVDRLNLIARPRFKTYHFDVAISDLWTFNLEDSLTVGIEQLSLTVDSAPQGTAIAFLGRLGFGDPHLGGARFDLGVIRRPDQSWQFSGRLAGQVSLSNLANALLQTLGGASLPYGLGDLVLSDLAFTYQTGARRNYTFQGALDWDTGVSLTGAETIRVQALASFGRPAPSPKNPVPQLQGRVGGRISTEIPYFGNLQLAVYYEFGPRPDLLFKLALGRLSLSGEYRPPQNRRDPTIITLRLDTEGPLSFGNLLTGMVQLVDPALDDFELEPPWDALNQISLDNLSFTINTTQKTVTASFPLPHSFSIPGILEITALGLTYGEAPPGQQQGVDISITGTFLGKSYSPANPLKWDALNSPPPAPPGQGTAFFDLRYLGLGQHVALVTGQNLDSVTKIIESLKLSLLPPANKNQNPLLPAGPVRNLPVPFPGQPEVRPAELRFDAASGWLIGAQFSLLDTFDLSFIFNDPLIYGARISLHGAKAKIFNGLVFEILYRRISDTIGVYHTELVLPEVMRNLEFGAVSITLPVIVLDIYTNGDFKIDAGFPWKGDFSRSFAVQVFPFVGFGGFYFNKLSAATATSTPAIVNGNFSPVLEFGLGLVIGVGKQIDKGVFKAEISITVVGVLQGVFAWFNPSVPGVPGDQYYRIQGAVGIVGRLTGSVDFEVIQVSVAVVVKATIAFVVEAYQPILITLSAEVSVSASIKIVFIRIHFHFSLKITQSFTIGSVQPTPWVLAPVSGGSPAGLAAWSVAQLVEAVGLVEVEPVQVEKETLHLYFQPAFTLGPGGVKGVALLFIENSIAVEAANAAGFADQAAENETDFDRLVLALLDWAFSIYYGGAPVRVYQSGLRAMYAAVSEQGEEARLQIGYLELVDFLKERFDFTIKIAESSLSGTIFPMFPELALQTGAGPVNYFSGVQLSPDEIAHFHEYFQRLKKQLGAATLLADEGLSALESAGLTPGEPSTSAAGLIFRDYFLLLLRGALQAAIDLLEEQEINPMGRKELLQALNGSGSLNHLAGMASRFMLHGLRLPALDDRTIPLYAWTRQQFDLTKEIANAFPVSLVRPASASWISFPAGGGSTQEQARLAYPLNEGARGLIRRLMAVQFPLDPPQPDLVTPPASLPFYQKAPRRFNLHAKTTSSQGWELWDLPENLRITLQQAADPAGASIGMKFAPHQKDGAALQAADIRPVENFAWGTRVDLTILRVPAAGGGNPLPDTYLLVGTNETGQEALEDLWRAARPDAGTARPLFLHLFSSPGSEGQPGLVERGQAGCLLLKTNLAAHSYALGQGRLPAERIFMAGLEDGVDFIRLAWEAGEVNPGGFFLSCSPPLPDEIFRDGRSATLTLLATLEEPGMTAAEPARSFHNCLVTWDTLNLDEGSLFAESADTVKAQVVPTGSLGIRLERNPSPAETEAQAGAESGLEPDGLAQVMNLYQLLSSEVADFGGFNASNEDLPLGPGDEADSGKWIYQRVVPIARLAKAPGTPPLAAGEVDPYRGVGQTVQMRFQWQDVYGNRLDGLDSLRIEEPVRYFDRLIGLNGWPGVQESYLFERTGSGVNLSIELHFDSGQYVPGGGLALAALQDKIRAAYTTFNQVYYQAHQPDWKAILSTSLLPGWTRHFGAPGSPADPGSPDDKTWLLDFVKMVCYFLKTALQLEPLSFTPAPGDTLEAASIRFNLSLAQLAEANADTPGLLGAGARLDLPLALALAPGQKPSDLIAGLEGSDAELARALVEKLRAIPEDVGAVQEGGILEVTLETVVKDGDSLRSIADAAEAIPLLKGRHLTVAEVARANPTAPLGPQQVTIPGRVSLPTGAAGSLTLTSGDTLAGLAQALSSGSRQELDELHPDPRFTRFTPADLIATNGSLAGILAKDAAVFSGRAEAAVFSQKSRLSTAAWQKLLDAHLTIRPNETLDSLLARLGEILAAEYLHNGPLAPSDLAAAIENNAEILAGGGRLLIPPFSSVINTSLPPGEQLAFPSRPIFPVAVRLEFSRSAELVHVDLLEGAPEILKIDAQLNPRPVPVSNLPGAGAPQGVDGKIDLRGFAGQFEAAFPGLHLASSRGRPHRHSVQGISTAFAEGETENLGSQAQSLWAVNFGPGGIHYTIRSAEPVFFAPAPLANTLLSGPVEVDVYENDGTPGGKTEIRELRAADLNALGRDFLAAVDAFLDPELAIPAAEIDQDSLESILRDKERLAEAIQAQVMSILEGPDMGDLEQRRALAGDLLRRQLLTALREGYAIETLVQFPVTVHIANDPGWKLKEAPRLFGQPVVRSAIRMEGGEKVALDPAQLSFTLSPASLPLSTEASYLTFFFDTKVPEQMRNVILELDYRVSELEYDIVEVGGEAGGTGLYQDSSWLTFIRPVDNPPGAGGPESAMGEVNIPIPLRAYPMPPGLILQRASADPDSSLRLPDIRQWQYEYVYEHLDAAQDTVETRVDFNTRPKSVSGSSGGLLAVPGGNPLFAPLANFAAVYPQLAGDLLKLGDEEKRKSEEKALAGAIEIFARLVRRVAEAWPLWQAAASEVAAADYTIYEAEPSGASKAITLTRMPRVGQETPGSLPSFPTLLVPHFKPVSDKLPSSGADPHGNPTLTCYFIQKSPEEDAPDLVYGEASIPDRLLALPDLDIIEHQDAWGAVWVTRNRGLSDRLPTNPAFLFQTPPVRFASQAAPVLVNSRLWDIAAIDSPDGQPVKRTLEAHLERLFGAVLPGQASQPYEFRLACRYVYTLAPGDLAAEGSGLLSSLPVLLGPRFPVPAWQELLSTTAGVRGAIIQAIEDWQKTYRPSKRDAMFVFSLVVYSGADPAQDSSANLPLLQIDRLALSLGQIAEPPGVPVDSLPTGSGHSD